MGVPQGYLTADRIENNFNTMLQAAIDTGEFSHSDSGLNMEVQKAIDEVAREYPSVTAVSIQNANQAYRRQVSGAAGAEGAASVRAVAAKLGIDTGDSLA